MRELDPAEHLARAGYVLPSAPPRPAGRYRAATRSGSVIRTSGQVPLLDGVLAATGPIGDTVSPAAGRLCAGYAVLNALAAVASEAGSLAAISRLVSMTVYILAVPGFAEHVTVADGASDVLATAFPGLGLPVRSAIGVASLPLNAPVEVEIVVEAHASAQNKEQ